MRIRTSLHLPPKFVLPGLLAAQALVACGGGGSSGGANERAALLVPSPMAPVPANAWEGRYVGSVTIDGVNYNGDALLTDDGMIRLYVGGLDDNSGVLPELTIPPAETSMQFYGSLQGSADQASGQGNIFGQQCASHDSNAFCNAQQSANINIAIESGNIQGQIVTIPGNDTWTLKLTPFSNYYFEIPASRQSLKGQYQEELAEFAFDGDTMVSIDAQGVLFFQSPHSGCTGNGMVQPHLNGAFNVYDASLTITGCTGAYVYLNTRFVGLATTSPSSQWNYDSLLLIWLTELDPVFYDEPAPPALTMLGSPLNQ